MKNYQCLDRRNFTSNTDNNQRNANAFARKLIYEEWPTSSREQLPAEIYVFLIFKAVKHMHVYTRVCIGRETTATWLLQCV